MAHMAFEDFDDLFVFGKILRGFAGFVRDSWIRVVIEQYTDHLGVAASDG